MSLHSHFLTLFIVLAYFSSCYGSYRDDPLYPRAYTTSKRTVQDRKFETESFGMRTRLARASTPSTSPKLFNVDDFGARGDGGDDTEVSHLESCLELDWKIEFLFIENAQKNIFEKVSFLFVFSVEFGFEFFCGSDIGLIFSHFYVCAQAFGKAWSEACSSKDSVLVVPKNRIYYLKPITFSGPCTSTFTLKVSSTCMHTFCLCMHVYMYIYIHM